MAVYTVWSEFLYSYYSRITDRVLNLYIGPTVRDI